MGCDRVTGKETQTGQRRLEAGGDKVSRCAGGSRWLAKKATMNSKLAAIAVASERTW